MALKTINGIRQTESWKGVEAAIVDRFEGMQSLAAHYAATGPAVERSAPVVSVAPKV